MGQIWIVEWWRRSLKNGNRNVFAGKEDENSCPTVKGAAINLEKIAEEYGPCDIVAADIEFDTPDQRVLDFINICNEISRKNEKKYNKVEER